MFLNGLFCCPNRSTLLPAKLSEREIEGTAKDCSHVYPVTNDFKDLVSRPFVALRLLSGGIKERLGRKPKDFPGI
ncbi:MAG: hypothetical protein KA801_07465 [Syntrophorhabdaceae bacterium]|nr:hypothetical protein [Syntrophorhabdaceae bacterium]